MTTLVSALQTPNPGDIVQLFMLDATSVGAGKYYFTPSSKKDTTPIVFGGVSYTPVDIDFTGFEVSGTGASPQPRIKVANTNGVFQSIVNSVGDLIGCPFSRVRTFSRFLDGQPDADPTAYMGPDAFRVEQKLRENPVFIEWSLSASIDEEGKVLPGRVVVRDTCLWRYRVWNGSSFDYAKAQCPYTGGVYFDESDTVVTDPSKDKPSRRLNCCKMRFGAGAALPFGGFPGVGRVHS
jgi:lambda family phage minor tail protein L